ncbi:MAG: LysR family transcriptional regulator [Thiotrichales bacterium]
MNFQSLQAFVAIAQTRSFSKAAEKLHLSQPAISKRIAVLEMQLNTSVFDRSGKSTALTAAGRILLPRAERLLLDMQQTQTVIENLAGEIGGRLRFGTSHHIGMYRLPNTLKAFAEKYPEVDLDIKFLESESASERVEKGELEFSLVTLPSAPKGSLEIREIWMDRLQIVKAKQPQIRLKNPAAWLREHRAILPTAETETRKIIEQHFAELNIEINAIIETNNLETIKKMVEIGLGWSVLPEIMIDEKLSTLSISDQPLARSLGVVMHNNRVLSNAGAALLEYLSG